MLGWTHIQDPEPQAGSHAEGHQQAQQEEEGQLPAVETKEAQESRMVELYNEAMSAQMEGRLELAKRSYRLALESPLLVGVPLSELTESLHRRLRYLSLKNTADILEGEGEIDEALHKYAAATEVDPSDVVVWLHMGRLCEKLGRLRSARHAYESALSQHPTNWEALQGLARVLDALGDKAACLAVVNRALRLDGTHPGMRSLRARLRKWMADPRAAAREDLHQEPASGAAPNRRLLFGAPGGADEGDEEEEDVELPQVSRSLHVKLDRSKTQHAWAELGWALLRQGRKLRGNVSVEVEERGAGNSGGAAAGGRRTPSRRVTEEQRLQELGGHATPVDGTGDQEGQADSPRQDTPERTANGDGQQGDDAMVVDDTGEEGDDDNASEAASAPANTGNRRVSGRQLLRTQAREQSERKETVTARTELAQWMSKHLEARKQQQQQQQQLLSPGLSQRSGSGDREAGWWDEGAEGGAGEGGGGGSGAAGEGEDEGAALARKLLLPFKGVHNGECDVCGDGGDLICCETCSTVYHMTCLLRPPSLSEDLYCDRCKEDAYKRAQREPKGVSSQMALFSSEVEAIVNEFLPSTVPNLGPLDLMHRLVLRLARVKEALVWEDGTVRRAALELEAASRPFARDLQVHTCQDAAQVVLDFGPEGELFLAELHLDGLLMMARGGGTSRTPGGRPPRPEGQGVDEEDGGEEEEAAAEGSEDGAVQAHAQACDVFLAKVSAALEAQQRAKRAAGREQGTTNGRVRAGSTGLSQLDEEEEDDDDMEEDEESPFDAEYMCRTLWLKGLLEAWRGHVDDAASCLEDCQLRLASIESNSGSTSIDLAHCQRYPVLSVEVVVGKKKELLELDDTKATARLVQAFRRGAEASKGGTPQAFQALVALVKRKFLLHGASSASPADRTRKAEELLMDFLTHEAHAVLEAGVDGDVTSWCQDLDYFNHAIRHQSILWLTLMACAKRQDLSSAILLLLTCLHYLTETDPWGKALIAKFLRVTPSLSPRVQPEVTKLNVYMLEALSHLLHMCMRKGWPESEPLPELVKSLLGPCLSRLTRFSLLPFSKLVLDAVLAVESTLAPLLTEGPGLALSRATFRGLCGVLSDSRLTPDMLLNYTNTKEAQLYVKSALGHLCDTLETQIQQFKRPLVPAFLSEEELASVVGVMCGLYRLADASPKSYGFLNFPSILALTMLIDQHPGLARSERLEWMSRAHTALAERVVLKELKGVAYLAAGFGECYADKGRFLRFVLQAGIDELDVGSGDTALQERAQEVTVQCLRCLYKIEVSTAAATTACADHQALERRPENFQEALVLAKFCVRYMAEEPGRSRPAMKTALRLVYQEPVFREPVIALRTYADVRRFLFQGGTGGEDWVPPEWLTHGKRDEEEEDDADEPTSYADYDKLEAAVGEEAATMVPLYRRFYHLMGDLNPAPKRKRGAQDTESFHAFEEDCLANLRMNLSDLRFNPRSLTTWLAVTEAVNGLLLLYLDHCPAFTEETATSAPALEASLIGGHTQGGHNHEATPPQLPPSVEPFISAYIGDKTSPPATRLRACLAGTPLDGFLPPEAPVQARGEDAADTGAAAGGTGNSNHDLDLTWAFLVSTAYRVLLRRCLGVLAAMLDSVLETDPTDDKVVTQRVEVSMRQASMAYMRRYNLTKDDPRQLELLQETLRYAQEAQDLETKYKVSRPRWDITFFMGRAIEGTRLLQHPGKSYAEIEALEPGWLSSFLTLYQRGVDLAESKFSKTAAYYRLHASRMRVLRADLRPGGTAVAPSVSVLQILRRYPSSGGQDMDQIDDDEEDEQQQDEAWAWRLRWSIVRDCLTAMVQCREKEKWDARSVYCRARTLHQLPGWAPPGAAPEELASLYAGLGSCRPGESTVGEARDVMVQLFDKRRPQICALWMPDDCKDHFDVINQRNRKYESLRWRYTEYYLTLLRTCEDYPRVMELYKWLKGGSGKDPSVCVRRIQAETLRSVVHVVGARLRQEPVGSVEVRGLLEVCYDVYLDLMEDLHQQHQQLVAGPEGGQAAMQETASSPTQGEASITDSMSRLVGEVEALLVLARSKLAPSAAVDPQAGALELVLRYCHDAWPVKQGEAKLDKVRGAKRKRRRRSSAAVPTGTGGAAESAAGAEAGEREEEEDDEEEGMVVKRRRAVGDGGGDGNDDEMRDEADGSEEGTSALALMPLGVAKVVGMSSQGGVGQEVGSSGPHGKAAGVREEEDDDDIVLNGAAEGSAVSSVRDDTTEKAGAAHHDDQQAGHRPKQGGEASQIATIVIDDDEN